MNAIEMLEQELKEIKRDGLFNADCGCSCLVGDLAPCETISSECQAGYKVPCDCEPLRCKYHITATKPTPT